jgi:hypothetical protein
VHAPLFMQTPLFIQIPPTQFCTCVPQFMHTTVRGGSPGLQLHAAPTQPPASGADSASFIVASLAPLSIAAPSIVPASFVAPSLAAVASKPPSPPRTVTPPPLAQPTMDVTATTNVVSTKGRTAY